jgi:hypothetical protein
MGQARPGGPAPAGGDGQVNGTQRADGATRVRRVRPVPLLCVQVNSLAAFRRCCHWPSTVIEPQMMPQPEEAAGLAAGDLRPSADRAVSLPGPAVGSLRHGRVSRSSQSAEPDPAIGG